MSLSTLRSFSKFPYFDDFDQNKNFHRILFVPARSVQTRELNQMQTILQDQIASLSDYIIADKSSVIGAKATYNKKMAYLKLAFGINGTSPFNNSLESYIGATFTAGTSADAVEGKILFVVPPVDSDPPTLYVQYTKAGKLTGKSIPDASSSVIITFSDGSVESHRLGADPSYTGFGSVVTLSAGILYVKKTFVRVQEQALILSKYNIEDITDKTYTIGVKIVETVVTPEMDPSLYDNATGSPNESAPGAHRYQITGVLVDKDTLPESDLQNFISLLHIDQDEIAIKPKEESSILPTIMSILARRTYDESGDYVVDTFDLDIREHLAVDNNNGAYTAAKGGREDLLCLQFDPGVAYVRGWEVRLDGTTKVDCPKARTTKSVDNFSVQLSYGNYIIVTPATGNVAIGSQVVFKDTALAIVGSALVVGIEPISSPTIKLKLYLTNIEFNANKGFNSVKTVQLGTASSFSSIFSGTFSGLPEDYAINAYNSTLIYNLPFGAAKSAAVAGVFGYKEFEQKPVNNNTVTLDLSDGGIFDSTNLNMYYIYGNGKSGIATSISSQSGGSSVVITVPNELIGANNKVNVGTYVKYDNPILCRKTSTLITQNISIPSGATEVKLDKVDGHEIIKIWEKGNAGNDLTSKFIFDTGARDSYYDNARLIIQSPFPANFEITVQYRYFEHSPGHYYSADSYYTKTGNAPATKLDYGKIPYYRTSSGQNLFLGAVVDFRPDSKLVAGGKYSLDSVNHIFSKPNQWISSIVEYYLGRYDRVMVTSGGNITLVQGEPSFNPKLPPELKDAITIYTLKIAPYTIDINSVVSEKIKHKRYTMKDIGILESRLETVEEMTLLNKLESDTASINFYNRFKSGYIVDNFSTSDTSDISNENFGVAYHLKEQAIRPKVKTEFLELDFLRSSTGQYQNMENVRFHNDSGHLTLDYEEVPYIEQSLGSTVIKVQPVLTYNYGTGTITLNPSTDVWHEELKYTNNIYTSTTNVIDPIVKETLIEKF